MTSLELDRNELYALSSALERYLDGSGIDDDDEDMPVLESLVGRLNAQL